ncbi:receptor-interacting serine/threonine-protein kinase 3-like [Lates japonicus]
MELLSHTTVGSESLEDWRIIGSGGFGHVYKAKHKDWGFDVAVKLLHDGCHSSKALFDEIRHMDKASCEFVLRVYGIYEGNTPLAKLSMQKGIVIEYMGNGSVQTLLTGLPGSLPWPLAFRLVHQVALGMNFLHSRDIMHQDLKPSNVLLNDDLNAKLADFGLSRVPTSVLNSNREVTGEVGGTYKYMPPEAFDVSYEPGRAFDRYSYGILLWSILTGKEPYTMASYELVALKIPLGDRPALEEIKQCEAEGLNELVDLMKMCWNENPSTRPHFTDCLKVTEKVFSKHKKGIPDAVHEVLKRLESANSNQHSSVSLSFPPQMPEHATSYDTVDHVRFTQVSASVSTKTMSAADKAKFVDDNRMELIQDVSNVMAIVDQLGLKMVHDETYSVIEAELTSQMKMRVLFQKTLRPGGVTVKAAFYDALKKYHPHLVERLSG